MSTYSFPGRRTQVTDLVVHQTARLDTGATASWGGLDIQGSNLTITGSAFFGDNVSIANNFSVNGESSFSGNIFGYQSVVVSQNTYTTNLYVGGTSAFGDLSIEGNVYISPGTKFYGDVVLEGNLTVTGLLTAVKDIYARNNLYVSNITSLAYLNVYNSAVMSNLSVMSNLVAKYLTTFDINASNLASL